ncbi:MAG: hypothetical protein IPK60_02550 [Sandaracinaceae bacterium]|nr:hypothetical protein [Sandaracinaceae bacterium]
MGTKSKLVDGLNTALAHTLETQTEIEIAYRHAREGKLVPYAPLFEYLQERLGRWAERLADRASALGSYSAEPMRIDASGRFAEVEADPAQSPYERVAHIIDRYAGYCRVLRKLTEQAMASRDPRTEWLYAEIVRCAELDMWTLQDHLRFQVVCASRLAANDKSAK